MGWKEGKDRILTDMKENLPNRVVYITFAPEDLAIAEELKTCLSSKDWPSPSFSLPKPVFAHLSGQQATLNRLRVQDAACVVLIYTEHTNGVETILQDLRWALIYTKPIFPVFLSDTPVTPELAKLVPTDEQYKADCFTRRELFAQLGGYEIVRCLFGV